MSQTVRSTPPIVQPSSQLRTDVVKLTMQCIISLGLLSAGLFLLLALDWAANAELSGAAAGGILAQIAACICRGRGKSDRRCVRILWLPPNSLLPRPA